MTTLERLLPGSYKGVRFLAKSFTTGGGRKTVKHSFPNSDKQVIEDLGFSPRTYSMQISINDSGGSYFLNRDRFIAVLEDGEIGKLTHPLYGDIENVRINGNYTLNEDLSELGEGRISVLFEVSQGTGIPEKSANTLHAIEATAIAATSAITLTFADGYSTSTNFPNSYTDSLTKVAAAGDAISNASNVVQASADKINKFTAQLNQFQNSVTELVRAPLALANSINSLFITMANLYPTFEATVKALEDVFNFGDDDTPIIENTASRIERARNRNILNDAMQSQALVNSYLNSAQIIFGTVGEIDARSDILDVQYEKLILSKGLDDSVKQLLTDLRVDVKNYFDDQKLTAQRVITVDTIKTSARLLAHQYYGSSEQGQALAELNNSSEPSFLEDDVKVLTV